MKYDNARIYKILQTMLDDYVTVLNDDSIGENIKNRALSMKQSQILTYCHAYEEAELGKFEISFDNKCNIYIYDMWTGVKIHADKMMNTASQCGFYKKPNEIEKYITDLLEDIKMLQKDTKIFPKAEIDPDLKKAILRINDAINMLNLMGNTHLSYNKNNNTVVDRDNVVWYKA